MRNLNGIQKWIDEGRGFKPHLSASKISTFKNDLPSFICRYGLGWKDPYNASMNRGNVCERWLVKALLDEVSIKDAVTEALVEYNNADRHYSDASHNKQLEYIPKIINNAYEALKDFGKPTFPEQGQEMIETTMHSGRYNWEAKIIGYLDLVYPESGLVVDLKTTLRMPSKMSWSHELQWALYKDAKANHDIKFLYVTHLKSEVKQPERTKEDILAEAEQMISKMNFFCWMLSPQQARKAIPIGDNFMWVNNENKGAYDAD